MPFDIDGLNKTAEKYMAEKNQNSSASGLSDLLAITCTVLSETDQKTVAMLKNLIANIEAGNVTTLDRSGVQTGCDTVELTLILSGFPDLTCVAND